MNLKLRNHLEISKDGEANEGGRERETESKKCGTELAI